MEKTAYGLLLALAMIWLLAVVGGMIAIFPFGLLGLVAIVALDRMTRDAERMGADGADGVVCLRFTTSAIMQGLAELLAYGTAVRPKPRPPSSP